MDFQKLIFNVFLSSTLIITNVLADCTCEPNQISGDKTKALNYKLIAIVSILISGGIGVSLPFAGKIFPALHPDKDGFFVVKTFAAGVILATAFIHILPQAFRRLTSPCLDGDIWVDFPVAGFVAMVLEVGIVVHSIIIGLSLGASKTPKTIKPLIVALSFHQMFEGLGLGGNIFQARIKSLTTIVMGACFALTTPSGIVVGILVSNTYDENSSKALIVQGVLDAAAAGILIYMALVDLLAHDFNNPRMQNNKLLLLASNVSLFLGAGLMSLLAKWV
ncbi:hypothetical protein QVD17_33380 [Tagetes erecta]|uniref:Uncharacterized protein n=1 Tax=Tagetes erecta TaxID=13708 RepID=A0AAD8JWP8_TARER|nr:hypothetical protein QVD17_33380 [Tagetes erecta]